MKNLFTLVKINLLKANSWSFQFSAISKHWQIVSIEIIKKDEKLLLAIAINNNYNIIAKQITFLNTHFFYKQPIYKQPAL